VAFTEKITKEKAETLINEFYASMKQNDLAQKTMEAYKSDVMQFMLFSGEPIGWTTGDIEDYKTKMIKNRLAISSIIRKLTAIRRYIEHYNEFGYQNGKITAVVKLMKVQKMEMLGEVITAKNIDKMIKIANERSDLLAAALFMSLAKTGCRISELLQWRVKDVGESTILVIGKGSKIREILPPEYLKYYLVDLIGDRSNPDEPIFFNKKTQKSYTRQRIDQIIKRYAKMAKVPKERAHAHSFRHQYGQVLTDKGLKIENVAELMGHSNINTTKIYSRSSRKQLMSHINKM